MIIHPISYDNSNDIGCLFISHNRLLRRNELLFKRRDNVLFAGNINKFKIAQQKVSHKICKMPFGILVITMIQIEKIHQQNLDIDIRLAKLNHSVQFIGNYFIRSIFIHNGNLETSQL